jgi:hypothetical protein
VMDDLFGRQRPTCGSADNARVLGVQNTYMILRDGAWVVLQINLKPATSGRIKASGGMCCFRAISNASRIVPRLTRSSASPPGCESPIFYSRSWSGLVFARQSLPEGRLMWLANGRATLC